MKKFLKLLATIIFCGAVYLLFKNWDYFKKTAIDAVSNNTEFVVNNSSPTDKIRSARFNNCKLIITDTSGEEYFFNVRDNKTAKCPDKFILSDSGRYVLFKDISNNSDLWIRIYSIEKNSINTLALFGTNKLLDMEFLPNDKLLTLIGSEETPDEQQLLLFDIPGVYSDYENNLIQKTDRFRTGKYERKLTISPVSGDFFDIVEIGNNIKIMGGSSQTPILRGEFNISSL